ncbi:hypothetical protein BDW22DRAFT_1354060 [Trametopsis cervina]|nr:hypothetical protein BDW22DRAFT_1354060 [Trametopsis cervina]
MSHEHRALGFRPPPGSLAAEAQAIVAKATEAKPANGTKARRMSNDVKPRRASNDMSPHSRRGSNESIGKPKMRRGSNETTEIRRSNSDESIKAPPKSKETRRKSMNVAGLSLAEKEVLLREVALKDAERIKATRGINGESASENAHVDLSGDKTVTSSPTLPALDHANLPGPVQEAQAAVADLVDPVQPAIDSLTQRVAVAPAEEHVATDLMAEVIPEQDEETFEPTHAPMSRTETGDSVQIVGDVRV